MNSVYTSVGFFLTRTQTHPVNQADDVSHNHTAITEWGDGDVGDVIYHPFVTFFFSMQQSHWLLRYLHTCRDPNGTIVQKECSVVQGLSLARSCVCVRLGRAGRLTAGGGTRRQQQAFDDVSGSKSVREGTGIAKPSCCCMSWQG